MPYIQTCYHHAVNLCTDLLDSTMEIVELYKCVLVVLDDTCILETDHCDEQTDTCRDCLLQTLWHRYRLELHTVKIRIVKFFPDRQKLNCIPVSHPVLNDKSGIIIISVFCDICQRNVFIFKILGVNSNIDTLCMNNFSNYFICHLYSPTMLSICSSFCNAFIYAINLLYCSSPRL